MRHCSTLPHHRVAKLSFRYVVLHTTAKNLCALSELLWNVAPDHLLSGEKGYVSLSLYFFQAILDCTRADTFYLTAALPCCCCSCACLGSILPSSALRCKCYLRILASRSTRIRRPRQGQSKKIPSLLQYSRMERRRRRRTQASSKQRHSRWHLLSDDAHRLEMAIPMDPSIQTVGKR